MKYLQSIAQNSNGLRKQSKALMQCGIQGEISDSTKIPKTELYLVMINTESIFGNYVSLYADGFILFKKIKNILFVTGR